MGAITVSGLKYENAGSQMKVEGQLTFSASYATGGDVITIKQLGMAMLDDLMILDSSGYGFNFEAVDFMNTAKVKVYNGTGGSVGNEAAHTHAAGAITVTPHADSAGVSTFTIPNGTVATAIGLDSGGNLVSATGTYVLTVTPSGTHSHASTASGAATAAGSTHTHTLTGGESAEVTNGTNLSTLTVDFVAYGA